MSFLDGPPPVNLGKYKTHQIFVNHLGIGCSEDSNSEKSSQLVIFKNGLDNLSKNLVEVMGNDNSEYFKITCNGDMSVGQNLNVLGNFSTFNGHLDIKGDNTENGEIKIFSNSTSNGKFVSLKAGTNITSDLSFRLPLTDGSASHVLKTDGSGNLFFGGGSGSMSSINDDTNPTLGGNLNINSRKIISSSNGNITIEPNGEGSLEVNSNIILNGNIIASGSLITSKNIKALEDLDVVRNIKVDNNVGLGKSVDTERLSVLGNINVNGNIIIREGLKVDNGTFSIDKENNILRVGTNKKITFDGDTSITEYIYGDGSNIILGTSNDVVINSTTAKLEFGSANSGEYIQGDGTDLIIGSGGDIVINSTTSKLEFGSANSGEYIQGDGTDLIIGSGGDIVINSTTSKLEFGSANSGEYIQGDGTDLIIGSGGDIVINSTTSKLEFGSANSGEYIQGDGNDLIIMSGGDVVINSTTSKLEFGSANSGEYIQGDGNDLILNATNDIVILGTKLEFGSANSGEYIRGDGNNLIIESGNNINLGSTNDVNIDSGSKINFLRTSTNYVEYTFDTHINYQCGLNRDLIFKINNSDTVASIARFDASANTFAMERNKKLTFDGETDQNEYIYGDGNSLNIGSANDVIINSANDVVINSGSSKLEFGSANSGTHINGNGIDMYANTQRDIHMVSANVVIHGNLELKGEGTGEFTISNNPSNPSADTSFMNFVSHPSNDNVVKDTSTPGEFSFAKFAKITLNGTPYWMQLFQFTS